MLNERVNNYITPEIRGLCRHMQAEADLSAPDTTSGSEGMTGFFLESQTEISFLEGQRLFNQKYPPVFLHFYQTPHSNEPAINPKIQY